MLSPALKWSSGDWANSHFGISADDAARSGLPIYSSGSGLTELLLNGHLSYLVNRQVAISAFGSVGRLFGDAADSPVVEERGRPQQAFFGVLLTRRF